MVPIKTVLFPTDYSPESRHAMAHATAIAGWYDALLVGLHVYQPVFSPVPGLAPSYIGDALTDGDTIRRMEADLVAALGAARAAGIRTDTRLESGDPARCIVAAALSLPADLIVIGTHGVGGFEHLVLGSVTEKVIRKVSCPVMTVPPRARATSKLPFRSVLCAVDFSEPSVTALRYALSIAQEVGARITVVHVLEASHGSDDEAGAAIARLIPDDVKNWCTPVTRVLHGKAYVEILGAAAAEDTDLIVMGVHGRNALDRMLFGSTTNQVVRRATTPVLTLRTTR